MTSKIDNAARAFVEAATALADAMLERLQAEAPDIAAKAAQCLLAGERMRLQMEFDPHTPCISWVIVGADEKAKGLISIPAVMPVRH